MKNSFVIYHDYEKHFKLLTNEELGIFMRGLMEYEISGQEPDFKDSGLLNMAFSFIKNDLDRNREKWEEKAEANRENGKKGGRPKKIVEESLTEEEPLIVEENLVEEEITQETQMVFEEPKKPVNVNVNVNVNDLNPPLPPAGEKNKKTTLTSDIDNYLRPFPTVMQEKLKEWLAYKKERKETYKDIGLRNFFTGVWNKRKIHSDEAIIELISTCMANNWKGIIWDKLSGGKSKDKPSNKYVNDQPEYNDLDKFYK